MKRLLALVSLTLSLTACSEPTKLVPTFDSLIGLPGLPPPSDCAGEDCCVSEGWCLDVETLSVRNTGGRTVAIESVSFAANETDGDALEAFSGLEVNTTEVAPGEQASLRFRYTSPDGAAQKVDIVISSDAEVNPTLVVGVEINAYVPPSTDAGPDPAPDGGGDDAGDVDAGDVDAGDVDAGDVDAGAEADAGSDAEPDAGEGDAG